ncbi:penicillin-binding protein PBP4 [Staphylococcus saccharolyticus]|uniref:penicillin-binding protein PBP4 n=1 Tax=Staphylococcus saccharolyticus TaxID=33028 RepID=UPI00102DFDFC|nr:penicillin-binding protein PBP4 [Staphylococcus saccharolyticus]MBL7573873.1 D-alanyl-D-alanine carboxypeptidase [Staphylococcus saccharolyticus]MBL7584876.1 D-alanyl-D-alanine carboxypeptidase [Staphylococcus saccharolyticus]MBL7639202.1 D-alanyl-D-alanine carboxypeptidase [Staphylococcus saccharolyticus]QRJ68527.1 penicillin-binding protein PBP4 [Staphylococcus saccharolyticus]TAA91846.1 penicillin-binding protein [Staphylococcus saccharolyticus]
MFHKVTHTTAMIGIVALLGTSLSYGEEKPSEVINHHTKNNISSTYEPDALTLTTQNGQILYRYHENKKEDPASLTKMMTMYLTLDAVKSGKIHMNDKIKITSEQARLSQLPNLSSVPLQAGQTYTVKQILEQTALASSNAAALVLGEKVSGSTSRFTDKMNKQAKDFGMKQTHYTSPAGADTKLLGSFAPNKYKKQGKTSSTSKDMNMMMYHMIKKHPEILKITKKPSSTQQGQSFQSTNLSLKGQPKYYEGTDGLKTGTSDTGYSLALTNQRNGLRLNETILNVSPYPSEEAKLNRNEIANNMMKYYRQQFEYKKVLTKGEHQIGGKQYNVKKDLYDVVPKNKEWHISINSKGATYVHYQRYFLQGSTYPTVKVEEKHRGFFKWLFK